MCPHEARDGLVLVLVGEPRLIVLPRLRGPVSHAKGRWDERHRAPLTSRPAARADVRINPIDRIGKRNLWQQGKQDC